MLLVTKTLSTITEYTKAAQEKLSTYQGYAVELAKGSVKTASNAIENGKNILYEKSKPVTTKVYGVYLGAHHTVYTLVHFITESSQKSIDYTKETASTVLVNAKKSAETVTVKTIDLSKSIIPSGIYSTVESKIVFMYNATLQTVAWTKSKASDPVGTLKSITPVFVITYVTVGAQAVSSSYQHGVAHVQGARKSFEEKVVFFYNRFMMGLNKSTKKDQ